MNIYKYIYICTYKNIDIYIHEYVCIAAHVPIHVYIYIHSIVHLYAEMYTCIYIYILYINICICVYIYIYIRVYMSLTLSVSVCVVGFRRPASRSARSPGSGSPAQRRSVAPAQPWAQDQRNGLHGVPARSKAGF